MMSDKEERGLDHGLDIRNDVMVLVCDSGRIMVLWTGKKKKVMDRDGGRV